MASAPYRVLCADIVGNAIREELPIQDLQYSFVLDAAGSFSGWISLDDPKCTRANLDPGATEIYIERGGQLVWGGILWTAQVDTVDRKLQLGGEGFWSYFKHRTIKNRTAMQNVVASATNTHYPDSDVQVSGVAGSPDNTDLYKNVDADSGGVITNTLTAFPTAYSANFDIDADTYDGLLIGSVRVKVSGSSNNITGTITPFVVIGGNTYLGQNVTVGSSTQDLSYTWSKNPATNAAWTSPDIDLFTSTSSAGFVFGPAFFNLQYLARRLSIEVSWGAGGTALFRGADQLAIVRDLINNAQAQPGGNIGVVVGSELTTDNGGTFVGRDASYYQFERKNTAQAVEDLAKLLNGFDFSVEVSWDPTGTIPQKNLRLYYPKRGRRIDGLVFNDNILGVSKVGVDVDGTVMANSVALMGNGDGDSMLISTVTDTTLLTRYPLLEEVFSAKDVTSQTTLDQQALATLARNKYPLENPSIEKQANTWPDFGAFQLGDEALVVTRDGWINVNSFQQIQQVTVNVGNEGQETMIPVFVSADGTVA